MGNEFALILTLLVLLLGGAGVGIGIGMKPKTWLGWAGFTGVAYLLGICLFMIVAQLLIVLGLPAWPALIALAAAAIVLVRVSIERPVRDRLAGLDLAATALFVLLVLVFIVLGSLVVIKNPLTVWDSWAIWVRKAIILGGSLDPFFTSKIYEPMHPDYPIGLPALQSAIFSLSGQTNTTTIDIPLWLMVPAGASTLAYLAPVRPRFWVPVVATILVLPPLSAQTLSGYADVPLVMLLAAGALAGGRWLVEDRREQLLTAAVFIAGAVCVKNEGVMVGLMLMALLTALRFRSWRQLMPAWLIVLAGLLPWRIWITVNGIKGDLPVEKIFDPGFLIDRIDRVGTAADYLIGQSLFGQGGLRAALLVTVLTAAAVLLALNWQRRQAVFGLLSVAGATAALLFAYWVSPNEINWYLLNSADRVILIPVVLLLVSSLLPLSRLHRPGSGANGRPSARPVESAGGRSKSAAFTSQSPGGPHESELRRDS